MRVKKLFQSTFIVIFLATGGHAAAATSDFISGIPNHLDEASFSEQARGRYASSQPGARYLPVQWLTAGAIITVSHHATFVGNDEARPMKAGWIYVPPVLEGRDWALFGGVLMVIGMLARRKTLPPDPT